jgi:hypothetical protein
MQIGVVYPQVALRGDSVVTVGRGLDSVDGHIAYLGSVAEALGLS